MRYKLGDICAKIGSGATPRGGKDAYCDKGITLVRSQNVLDFAFSDNGLAFINEEQAEKLNNVQVSSGDVLLNITGDSVARACMMDDSFLPARVNQHVAIIRGKTDIVINQYLLYFLQWQKSHLLQLASGGATRNALTKGMIEQLEIELPPLKQQKKVVNILGLLDDKIALNNKINKNLKQQARLTLNWWMVEHSGEYESLPLSDIATVNSNVYSPKEQWHFINYLDTSSITDGTIAELQHIVPTIDKLPSRARRKIIANDVVFSTVRPNQHHFGIIKQPVPNMLASTGFAVIRSKTKEICNELIYLRLTEDSFIESMQQIAEQSTSTFPSIKPSDLYQCEIPCPLDDKLTILLENVFSIIAINQKENLGLSQLRDALLPKLMNGEIEIY